MMTSRRGIAPMVIVLIVVAVVAVMMSAFMAYEMSKMDPAGTQDEILQNLTEAVQEAQTQLDQVSTRLTEYLAANEAGTDEAAGDDTGDGSAADSSGDTAETPADPGEPVPVDGTETEIPTETADTPAGDETTIGDDTDALVDEPGVIVDDPDAVTTVVPDDDATGATEPQSQAGQDNPLVDPTE